MTRRTVARGSLTMEQDITKALAPIVYPSQTWVPEGEIGDSLVLNGSDFWFFRSLRSAASLDLKIRERDSVKVAKLETTYYSDDAYLFASGEAMEHPCFGRGIFDLSWLVYLSGDPWTAIKLGMDDPPEFVSAYLISSNRLALSAQWSTRGNTAGTFQNEVLSEAVIPGFVRFVFRLDYDAYNFKAKAYNEGQPDPGWLIDWTRSLDATAIQMPTGAYFVMSLGDSSGVIELAEFSWEQVG